MPSNSTIETILNHRSTRNFDPNYDIPKEQVDLILRSGQRASTSASLQMYTIIEIPKEMRTDEILPCGPQQFIRDASFFCIIYSDLHRINEIVRIQGSEPYPVTAIPLTMGVFDAGIMAQNMVIAAESMGYGVCFCGACGDTFSTQRELLKLPKHLIPITGLAIGKPLDEPQIKPRYPSSFVFHRGEYKKYSREELEEAIDLMSKELSKINNREIDWQKRVEERFTQGWAERRETIRIQTLREQGFDV